MSTPQETIWEIEPHTLAKHEILRRYLSAWFPILGAYNARIVYIDGFCGPGRYKGGEEGSPIIALQQALKHSVRLNSSQVGFLFVDERPDRIAHLKSELAQLSIPSNFSTRETAGDFEAELRGLLDSLDAQNQKLAPTFAFIDPFGFKGLPFDLVSRLLRNPKTEVFVNIMVDAVNRFLEHPDSQIQQHIVDLFGTPKVLDIPENAEDRIAELRLLYQTQLSQYARFVRYFEMHDENRRIIYYLFFASNHPLGHIRMKEAFWKVDASSGYFFSDATDPNQLVLFNMDPTPQLASDLQKKFSGQKMLSEQVQKYTEDETAFTKSHMLAALKSLENENKIQVDKLKKDGEKRRKNSFPEGVIIQFQVV